MLALLLSLAAAGHRRLINPYCFPFLGENSSPSTLLRGLRWDAGPSQLEHRGWGMWDALGEWILALPHPKAHLCFNSHTKEGPAGPTSIVAVGIWDQRSISGRKPKTVSSSPCYCFSHSWTSCLTNPLLHLNISENKNIWPQIPFFLLLVNSFGAGAHVQGKSTAAPSRKVNY